MALIFSILGSQPPREYPPQRIAFMSTRDRNFEIYVMDDDGTGQTRLTKSPGFDGLPCFSPDGAQIVFCSDRDPGSDYWAIYVMNADGSNQLPLTDSAHDHVSPCFSPDGSKIAFASDRANDN